MAEDNINGPVCFRCGWEPTPDHPLYYIEDHWLCEECYEAGQAEARQSDAGLVWARYGEACQGKA